MFFQLILNGANGQAMKGKELGEDQSVRQLSLIMGCSCRKEINAGFMLSHLLRTHIRRLTSLHGAFCRAQLINFHVLCRACPLFFYTRQCIFH
jgi:hypothetical protein